VVSVLARCFEEAGIATTGIAMVREHVQRVKPPRMLWVPFAFGNALGRPGDPEFQHQVLKAALDLLDRDRGPVLEDYPDDTDPEILLQASEANESAQTEGLNAADEVTALRPYYERWVKNNNGRTAVGVCRIPQRRFRGIIRFLEAYSQGEDTDTPERPAEFTVPHFIRYCVDDLKAFCYEARMEQRPQATEPELHEWFWGGTAVGKLVVQVADFMKESEDPEVKAIPYGLAR
jgi:hypothetical protein